MAFQLQFSTGCTLFFLFLTVTTFVPAPVLTITITTKTSTPSLPTASSAQSMKVYDDEADSQGSLQLSRILHGPLTALNGRYHHHQKEDKGEKESWNRSSFQQNLQTGYPPVNVIPSIEKEDENRTSSSFSSYATSFQHSGQVLHSLRAKRSSNEAVNKQNGKRDQKEEEKDDDQHHHFGSDIGREANDDEDDDGEGDLNQTFPSSFPTWLTSPNNKHPIRRRSTNPRISPELLFLKIFTDYSSPNEENSMRVIGRRRRQHRSYFRTNPDEEVQAMHVNEKRNTSNPATNVGGGSISSTKVKIASGPESPAAGTGTTANKLPISTVHHNSSNNNGGDHVPSSVHSNTSTSSSTTLASSCPVGHFGCTSNPSLCVPQSAICNGKADCPDKSDEYKCVNLHEKKFWDTYFQKRPASDDVFDEGEQSKKNDTCFYKAVENADEGEEESQQSFFQLLAKGMCRCSKNKVLCQNANLPNLQGFPKDISFLDLSGCRIDNLEFIPGRFQLLHTLVLSSCSIRELTSETFTSLPSLKILHLTGNHLKRIPPSAFSGNSNLSKLFLGHNQLETIDSQSFHGLHSLEILDLRKNRLTGEDFNVFEALAALRVLHLSFNEISNINKEFLTGLSQLEVLSLTKNKISSVSHGALSHTPLLKHLYLSYNKLSILENGMFCGLQDLLNLNLNDNGITKIEPKAFECLDSLQSLILEKNPFRELGLDEDGSGNPRELFANLTNLQHIYFDEWWMCWWAPHVRSCAPKGDGISSVDNLLDNVILRVCVWIMGSVAVGGNLFVIISRLVIREKNRAHSFYIKNLALADLLMGLFLLSIAFHDMSFRGHFLAHQHAWRHSLTCQFSGMLSTLSSEASVFILFLITLDRYLSIVRPFAERTNALIPAILICGTLWFFSVMMSYAPMCPWFSGYFGKSFYTSNGLCLPLHIHNPYETGWEYSLFLFILVNSFAFTFICYAYWKMLRIIQTSTTSIRSTQQKQDGMLVKRFGLVVATDFLCWAPIIIIKCVAMSGVPIQSDLYAWLAVFVLPVNSALNPVIYTLSTKLFKQQVSHITIGFRKRLGLATDDSTTSSFFYRNRISRTLQTSLNSSMMLSTRRHGERTNSTKATVLKERMAMSNRMSSKVGSGYSPPSPASTGGRANTGAMCVSTTAASASASTSGVRHPIKENDRSESNSCGIIGGPLVVPRTENTNKVAEINGQIVQHQQHDHEQDKVDGSEMMMTAVVESQL